jgi:hypothetical protein
MTLCGEAVLYPHKVQIEPFPIGDRSRLTCSCGWTRIMSWWDFDTDAIHKAADEHVASAPYLRSTIPEMTDFTDLLKRG